MNKDGFFDYFRAMQFYPGCINMHKTNRHSSTRTMSQNGACSRSATIYVPDENLPSRDTQHVPTPEINMKARKRPATIEARGARDKKKTPNNDDPDEMNGESSSRDTKTLHHRGVVASLNVMLHPENREDNRSLPPSLLASVEEASQTVANSVAGLHASGEIDERTIMAIGFLVGYQEGCTHVRRQYEDPMKRQFLMP